VGAQGGVMAAREVFEGRCRLALDRAWASQPALFGVWLDFGVAGSA
jgi:hypothetical protein